MTFEDGQELLAIGFEDKWIKAGRDCAKIVVVMEYGIGSYVPWFLVYGENGKPVSKWNSNFISGIVFK